MNIPVNTGFSNLTPYLYSSSSSEEENCLSNPTNNLEEVALSDHDIEENQLNNLVQYGISLSKKNFENGKMLDLPQAQNLLAKIKNGVVVHHLSILNIQYVEIIKIMREMSQDLGIVSFKENVLTTMGEMVLSGKNVMQDLSHEIHLIFADFRRYSLLFEGRTIKKTQENLLSALVHYADIARLYGHLKDICAIGNLKNGGRLCLKLKQQLDIIYHLCHCEEFLTNSLKSLSFSLDLTDSLLLHPPQTKNLHFYFTSVDTQLYALDLFNTAIQIEYSHPLEKAMEELKQSPLLADLATKELSLALQCFVRAVACKDLVVPFHKIVIQAKNHKHNATLKNYFHKLDAGTYHHSLYEEMALLTKELYDPWGAFSGNFDLLLENNIKQIRNTHIQVAKSIQNITTILNKKKGIKTTAKNRIINQLNAISKCTSSEKYTLMWNAYVADPMRNIQFSILEIALFMNQMVDYRKQFKPLANQLLAYTPQVNPCTSFFALDLLIYQISKLAITHYEQKHDARPIKTLFDYLPLIFSSIEILQSESIIVKQNFDNIKIRTDLIKIFIQFSESLSKHIEDKALHDCLHTLLSYLALSSELSFPYVLQLLMHPLSQQEEIDSGNVALIKDFFSLLALSMNLIDIEPALNIIEIELKNKMNEIPKKQKFFWALNLKKLSLLRYHFKAIYKSIEKFSPEFLAASDAAALSLQLHKWHEEQKKNHKLTGNYIDTFNILSILSKDNDSISLTNALDKVFSWKAIFDFFNKIFSHLSSSHPLPIKPKKNIPNSMHTASQPEIIWNCDEEIELNAPDSTEPTASKIQAPEQLDSPYSSQINLVNKLKQQTLKPLSAEETPHSYFFRVIKRQEALKNITFYLALHAEALQWNAYEDVPMLLKVRQQIDLLLLLEATEKIALCTLRLAAKEDPNEHIASTKVEKSPLLYAHDGVMFLKLINLADNNWLTSKKLAPVLLKQQTQLKRTYWFKEDPILLTGIAHIRIACEGVLQNLASFPSSSASLITQANEYSQTNKCLHKFKRKHHAITLPSFSVDIDAFKLKCSQLVTSLKFDPQGKESSQANFAALTRVFDMHTSLNNYDKPELIPLYYCSRSAEIQVSLLSLVMQVMLSTHHLDANVVHPLFLDASGLNLGRPLIHTHRVDRLYQVLKEKMGETINQKTRALMDEYIGIFIGDPRYPYPNKTLLTNELVKMQQKVHLRLKLREGGFLSEKEEKMLRRHIGHDERTLGRQEAILTKSILAMLNQQRQKTAFAFYLAEKLLNSENPLKI